MKREARQSTIPTAEQTQHGFDERILDQAVEVYGPTDDRYYWLSVLGSHVGDVARCSVACSVGKPSQPELRSQLLWTAGVCVYWLEHYTGNTIDEILDRIKAHGPRSLIPAEPMMARLLGNFSDVVKQVRAPNNPVGARNELVTMCRTLKAWWQQEQRCAVGEGTG